MAIEKRELNELAKYWFTFISSTLMPIQNEAVVRHKKAALLGCIFNLSRVNVGAIIYQEMILRARRQNISFPFPTLITALCRRAGVEFNPAIDVELMASAVCEIRGPTIDIVDLTQESSISGIDAPEVDDTDSDAWYDDVEDRGTDAPDC